MNDSEVKARLAQAEGHFSHYRWDAAMACFEAILAGHPDHPAATQGWANAVEQKAIDEELGDAVAKARAALAEQRFDEALRLLNLTQTRGALTQILRYHGEIDGLRSEAQEGREWQQRVETANREAGSLATRRRFDQALELLDGTLGKLKARGWERLGNDLTQLRERLWAERDVSERVQFAAGALERQDYRLATELAATLREELPERDDVRRLHQRAASAWRSVQERVAGVEQALQEGRGDEAIALLAALREEHPQNPEWQGIWLRVHMGRGREDVGAGRSAMIEHRFTDAADAFERARAAFRASAEVFAGHPTAAAEEAEALAMRDGALQAGQAVRDRAAFRWLASRQGWQASRERIEAAAAVRGRDFGDVSAVVNAMLSEAAAIVADLDEARLMLARGREALQSRDAGQAREQFRQGLARLDTKTWEGAEVGPRADIDELRRALAAGLREAERVQRDAKKLIAQSGAAQGASRLKLLRQAFERWESAPGLVERLAGELLATAHTAFAEGDEVTTAACCEEIRELTAAPPSVLGEVQALMTALEARQVGEVTLAEAEGLIRAAETSASPDAALYARAIELLRRLEIQPGTDRGLAERVEALTQKAQQRREQLLAAEPHLARSRALAEAGDWLGAASALDAAKAALGDRGEELTGQVEEFRRWGEQVESGLQAAAAAIERAEELYAGSGEGDLSEMPWEDLARAINEARSALKPSSQLPARLPRRWEQMRERLGNVARRVETLRVADEQIRAGNGVEAAPMLQVRAVEDGDPVLLAVLERLVKDTAGDAAGIAERCLVEAETALRRGELTDAGLLLERARGYVVAAPHAAHQIRRVERQIVALRAIRAAVTDARAHLAGSDTGAALECYRRALQVAAGGDAGLGDGIGQRLDLLLDAEDELTPEGDSANGVAGSGPIRDAVASLLDGDSSSPLTGIYLAPALRGWWKLAQRAARLAFAEAQMRLGRDEIAFEAAARLVEAYPRDAESAGLYERAARERMNRVASAARRRLERAQRLAGSGALDKAIAQLDRLESELLSRVLPVHSGDGEIEAIRDQLNDLRHEWNVLHEIATALQVAIGEMREQALVGERAEALAAYRRARILDPKKLVTAAWQELDQLAALVGSATASAAGSEPPPTPSPAVLSATSEALAVALPVQVVDVVREEARENSPAPQDTVLFGWTGETADDGPRERRTEEQTIFLVPPETADAQPGTNGRAYTLRSPEEEVAPESREHLEVAGEAQAPQADTEPPAPFDLDDWLSNVSEMSPEDV